PSVKTAVNRAAIKAPKRRWVKSNSGAVPKHKNAMTMPKRIVCDKELANMAIFFKTRNGPKIPQEMAMQPKTAICTSSDVGFANPPENILEKSTWKNSKKFFPQ